MESVNTSGPAAAGAQRYESKFVGGLATPRTFPGPSPPSIPAKERELTDCCRHLAIFRRNRSRLVPRASVFDGLRRVNPSLQHKTTAAFAIAVLVLLLFALAAGWNARRFDDTLDWVEHTHDVLGHLDRVSGGLIGLQSVALEIPLAEDRDLMMSRLEQATSALEHTLTSLRRIVADNDIQGARLAELEAASREASRQLEEVILQLRGGSARARVWAATSGPVERAHTLVSEMQATERQLLSERGRRARQAAHRALGASLVACALATAFLIARALMVRRDLRERQRTEAALRKSQLMFKRLFDQAPDAVIQVDTGGRIVRANQKAEQLFGWNVRELDGQRLEQLLPQRYHARHAGHLAAYFAAPRKREMGAGLELFGRKKDNSEFPLDIMLSPIETDEGLQALAIIRDVSERKANEEKIRHLNLDLQLQNARLEIANKELESFSYSVSHDLRAPLRHIDGFASLLSKHAGASLDEKGRRFLAVISDSARRMGRLIDDLLTFSRMGRAQLEPGEIDHDQLVAAVIRESGLDRDRRIVWEIEPLPRVQADPAMLRQVWFNLIENAAKYSARSELPRIRIGSLPPTPATAELVFFVRDNGVGFDMKYAAKLFGVFQRLHSEAEFEGTGIGLANVRRIITRHGGRTWAEGRVGEGATFYFALPLDPAPTPNSTSPFPKP